MTKFKFNILTLMFFILFSLLYLNLKKTGMHCENKKSKTSENQKKPQKNIKSSDSANMNLEINLEKGQKFDSAIFKGLDFQKSKLIVNRLVSIDLLNKNTRTPIILLWTPYSKLNDFGFGLGKKVPFIDHKCSVFNCEITNDKSKLNESDMVLFHGRLNFTFPNFRPKNQRWVFSEFEPPTKSPNYAKFNNIFNHTYTYRLDSEFSRFGTNGYTKLQWGNNPDFDENKDFLKGKTKFAVAVISHCGAHSKRDIYIEKLREFVPVDVYGKCGIECIDKYSRNSKCKQELSQKYKFYLAFENSICKDYITEKFFEVIRLDIIPVVLGGGDYDFFVPKSAYINALDFKGPKELAKYLKYLDGNKTAYNSYFKWKKNAIFKANPGANQFCEMCQMLNLQSFVPLRHNIIENIGEFWGTENCVQIQF